MSVNKYSEESVPASKSRLAILYHYFTGGGGGEFDTYKDPVLYDKGAHSPLYRRDNLARGVADVVDTKIPEAGKTKILDIGAGTGILTLELAKRNHAVTALDLFPQPLERLKQKAIDLGRISQLTTVEADMNSGLPFEGSSFGHIVSLRATRYISNFDNWLSEANRVLEPGGTFVLPVFPVDTLPWKRHSEKGIFQPTTVNGVMSAVAAAGFEAVESEKYTAAVDLSLGERDVPFYYKPTFVVAEKPL